MVAPPALTAGAQGGQVTQPTCSDSTAPLLTPILLAKLRRLGSTDPPKQITEGSTDELACRTLDAKTTAE